MKIISRPLILSHPPTRSASVPREIVIHHRRLEFSPGLSFTFQVTGELLFTAGWPWYCTQSAALKRAERRSRRRARPCRPCRRPAA